MNNEPYDFDDDKEAVKFHRLYAEQGDAEAQCNLGMMTGLSKTKLYYSKKIPSPRKID